MPEVLTRVDPDDSVEKKFLEKKFPAPFHCLRCDYTTRESHDSGANYSEQQEAMDDHLNTEHPYVGITFDSAKDAQLHAERSRLERVVLDAAIEEYKMERAADYGSNTITRTEALIKTQRAMKVKREAVAALLDFETKTGNEVSK